MTDVFKLIEANGLTLHGDIEHFASLVRADERELVLAAAIDGAEHAARKAVIDEREACAKVCETAEVPIDIDVWQGTKKALSAATALGLAAAIRARGE